MTTIKLHDGDLGSETILVRCDLREGHNPIEVDYRTGNGWEPTGQQCAAARHTINGLVKIGKQLAATALEMSEVDCEWEEIAEIDLRADGKVDAIAKRGADAIYRRDDGQTMLCQNWGSYSPIESWCEEGEEFTSDDGIVFVVRDGEWVVE
jgi:hypothetical protein